MPTYKLTYFNIRGRAETARMIFKFARVPFKDERIKFEDWPAFKTKTAAGKMPILEVDGKTLGQSAAIKRFLARKFGLTGADEWEAAECDMLVDSVADIYAHLDNWRAETDPDRKAKLREKMDNEVVGPFLVRMNERVKATGTGYLIGKQLTWADMEVFERVYYYKEEKPHLLEDLEPLKKEFFEKVKQDPKLKNYIATWGK